MGAVRVAKPLSAEGVPSPRASDGPAPEPLMRAILLHPLSRGEVVVWARARGRDTWGRREASQRPRREGVRTTAGRLRARWRQVPERLVPMARPCRSLKGAIRGRTR
jgi:hypothetical protein